LGAAPATPPLAATSAAPSSAPTVLSPQANPVVDANTTLSVVKANLTLEDYHAEAASAYRNYDWQFCVVAASASYVQVRGCKMNLELLRWKGYQE